MSGSSPTSLLVPGLDYCSLANTRSIPVAQELTRRFRDPDLARDLGRLHINISGCINACGHHHVGHIGLLGVEKNGEEYFQVTIGGRADESAELGALLGPAVPYAEVADVVEDIVAAYLELRARPDEIFSKRSSEWVSSRSRSASMPLVRGGHIVADQYLRVLDDAPIPDGVPTIVPAARFLADASEIARREAPTGVLWPNNRRVLELAPYLDRVALIALVFPSFKDGRAYSQARLLREQLGFRGELRATGNVLRDQFLFLVRAGFDSFEVGEGVRCRRIYQGGLPLQRVLPARRRPPDFGAESAPPARAAGGGWRAGARLIEPLSQPRLQARDRASAADLKFLHACSRLG